MFSKFLGERLRAIRQQKGWSLKEVEKKSRGKFKASALGAYERGERNLSVPRLDELSRFYKVPLEYFLMTEGNSNYLPKSEHITIDLKKLDKLPQKDKNPFLKYLQLIQTQRGDFNDKVVSIRRDDMIPLSFLYHTTPSSLTNKFEELGVIGTS